MKGCNEEAVESLEEEIADTLKDIQSKKFENDIRTMKELNSKKGKAASHFWLRDKTLGKKKNPPEQIALRDPESGFLVYKPEDIKRVSLDYCVNLLSTKEPKSGYEEIFSNNERMHKIRMKEKVINDIEELPDEVFLETLQKLKLKPGNKYDFLIKGGNGLKMALLNLYKTVWREEKIPKGWTDSTVIQLFKNRGSINELANFCHIHDKLDVFKLFNQLVIYFAKQKIIANMSKYQIACVPKHRSSEHLFVIKSVIELYQKDGKGMILSGYDVKTFFDSENIYDW